MWCRVVGSATVAALVAVACGTTEHRGDEAGQAAAGGGGAGAVEPSVAGSADGPVSNGAASSLGGQNASAGGEGQTAGEPSSAGAAVAAGGAAPEPGPVSCQGYYVECGCGCCGNPPFTVCLYPELGESFAAPMARDQQRRDNPEGCAAAGCSAGLEHMCCAGLPSVVDDAEYEAQLVIGNINRIHVSKTDASCTTLVLREGFEQEPLAPPLETPAGWQLELATSQACSSSATPPREIGALGQVVLRPSADGCVLDAHLTLFFGDGLSGVTAERLDVDGLAVDLPLQYCP